MEKERKIAAPEWCEIEKEIKIMKASHEFEVSRIKTQLLADITCEIVKKYDFVTYRDIEEIAKKARIIVYSVFGEPCKKEGGDE